MPRSEQPLDDDGSALVAFAADLRKVRQAAGGVTYRDLARRAHFSATTLSDAAGGKRVPSLAVTLAYVEACGGDVVEWEARWRAVARESAQVDLAVDGGRAPYAGLASYRADDAEWFHGREALVDDLVALVAARRFVTVVGPSGVGKSSVLHAGLVPRLAATSPVVTLTPGAHPVEECAVAVARLVGGTPGPVLAELTGDARGLHRLARQAAADDRTDVVLVVDQFEELFSLCRDDAQRTRFVDLLIQASATPGSRCRVVIGVRADFYGHCLQHPGLAAASREAHLPVGPMGDDELRRAITGPARRADCAVESALVTTLVAQTSGRAAALPLLSHVLLETWRLRKGNTLTLAGYPRTGEIDGALAASAETAYSALDPAGRTRARDLFVRLVELGEGTQDTKRRVPRAEFDPDDDPLLARFTDARLLALTDRHVEISHEALIGGWPRLRSWLAEDRDGLRVHRTLTDATATWVAHAHDPGSLLRGARLSAVKEWAPGRPEVNAAERRFLDASVAADDRERRAARRRRHLARAFAVALVVLAVTAVTTAIRATDARRHADRERTVAVALTAVRTAHDLLDTDPGTAARIALAAYRFHPVPATRDALIATSAASSAVPLGTASSHTVLDPSGRVTATADRATDTTTLTATPSTTVPPPATVPGGARMASFTQDGHTMATVDHDAVARLWDTSDPNRPQLVSVLPAKAQDLRFTPDGSLLASTDVVPAPPDQQPPSKWTNGRASRLWDTTDPRRPRMLSALPDAHGAVFAFSHDARTLVTIAFQADSPRRTRVWDLSSPRAPRLARTLDGPETAFVHDALFVPGTPLMVTIGGNAHQMWDLGTPSSPRLVSTLDGRSQTIGLAAASPDGLRLATAGLETGNLVWDVSNPAAPRVDVELRRQRETVLSHLTFGRDGASIRAVVEKHDGGGGIQWRALTTWLLDAEAAAAVVCDTTTPLSEAQWSAHLGTVPQRSTCG